MLCKAISRLLVSISVLNVKNGSIQPLVALAPCKLEEALVIAYMLILRKPWRYSSSVVCPSVWLMRLHPKLRHRHRRCTRHMHTTSHTARCNMVHMLEPILRWRTKLRQDCKRTAILTCICQWASSNTLNHQLMCSTHRSRNVQCTSGHRSTQLMMRRPLQPTHWPLLRPPLHIPFLLMSLLFSTVRSLISGSVLEIVSCACAGMDISDVASTCSSFPVTALCGSYSYFPVSLPRGGGHWYSLLRTVHAFLFFFDSSFYPLARIVPIIRGYCQGL